ncbi:hypothetical protein AB3S75_018163 [Citrus x aurantiifolia]
MAQVISFRYSFALILTCSFMMAAPGLATVNFENPLIEGGQGPDAAKCLSTLESVHGCVQEVITAFLSLKVNLIGNACCKAFNEVDTNCWPKVFPFDPFFPPLLQSYCTTIVKNEPPTSIPQKQQQQNAPSPSPALFKRLE